jgi:hypothetical protein
MMNKHDIKLQKAWMLVCLIDEYYKVEPTGGTVHVILDDANYGLSCDSLIEYSKQQGDYWGELIATLLSELTEDEQEQIVERGHEIYEKMFCD